MEKPVFSGKRNLIGHVGDGLEFITISHICEKTNKEKNPPPLRHIFFLPLSQVLSWEVSYSDTHKKMFKIFYLFCLFLP